MTYILAISDLSWCAQTDADVCMWGPWYKVRANEKALGMISKDKSLKSEKGGNAIGNRGSRAPPGQM